MMMSENSPAGLAPTDNHATLHKLTFTDRKVNEIIDNPIKYKNQEAP
jgi:hypothetical protein